jgi:hypothetical protein
MNELSTTDIILAAYLKVQGYRMVELARNGNKGTFIFADIPDEIINEYDLGSSRVEPKALNYEIKALTTAARR